MARKSAAQRMNELTALIAGYDEDPAAKKFYDWDYRFCHAMLEKLRYKRALSKKMRTKIDLIVEEGVKSAPHYPEADEMDRLSAFLLDENTKRALGDFAYKIRKGWALSVKQKNFADKLMDDARNVEKNGYWTPCEETREKMKLVLKLRECYNEMYWSTHGAGARALYLLGEYVQGGRPHISEKIWESAKHAVRGKLKMFEQPRFSVGDKCFIRLTSRDSTTGDTSIRKAFGIICSEPMIYQRSIGYDVLLEGKCQTWTNSMINKR